MDYIIKPICVFVRYPFQQNHKIILPSGIPCLRKGHLHEPTKHPDPSSRRAASGLSGLLRQPGYPDTQHRRSGSRRRNLSKPLYGFIRSVPHPAIHYSAVCMCTSMLHGTTIVHCPPAIRLFQSSCVKTDTKPPQSEKCI